MLQIGKFELENYIMSSSTTYLCAYISVKTERETTGLQRLVPRTNILVIGRSEHKPTYTWSGSSSKRVTNKLHSQQKQVFEDNITLKMLLFRKTNLSYRFLV